MAAGVQAHLRYRKPAATVASVSGRDQDIGENRFADQTHLYPRRVLDARPFRSSHSLFENGFVLADHPLGPTERPQNWYDKEHVRGCYHPAARALVKRLLPQHVQVVSLDHIARNEADPAFLGAHHLVHNDFTEAVLPGLAKIAPGSKFVARMPQHRVMILNIWRPTQPGPLRRNPLAVCDRRTISRDDLHSTVLSDYGTQENPIAGGFAIFTAEFRERHQWHYFSDLTWDEAMVFVTFDSHPPGGVFVPTMHTAVSLPGQEREPPRESCEIRCMVLLPLPADAPRRPAAAKL